MSDYDINMKRVAVWAMQMLFFVVIPVTVFYFGFSNLDGLREKTLLMRIEQSIESDLREMEAHYYAEPFLVGLFREMFHNACQTSFPGKVLQKYHARLNGNFNYLLWDSSGRLISYSGFAEEDLKDWVEGRRTLKKAFEVRPRDQVFSDSELINIRSLMGSQLLLETVYNLRHHANEALLWNDSSGIYPRAWFHSNKQLALLIFVEQEMLLNTPGLDYYLKYRRTEGQRHFLGYVKGVDIHTSRSVPNDKDASEVLRKHNLSSGLRFETAVGFYYPRVLAEKFSIFAGFDRENIRGNYENSGFVAAIVVFILLLPVIVISSNNLLTTDCLRFSLSRKLTLLFIYANGLPLAVLFFLGHDYIHQKEYALYDEIHANGIRFLQNFDERFESEHSTKVMIMQKAIANFANEVSGKNIDIDIYRSFVGEVTSEKIKSAKPKIFIAASDSRVVGNADFLVVDDREYWINKKTGKKELPPEKREEFRFSRLFGSYILANLNGDNLREGSSAEVELLAESLMQKPMLEVQNDFIAGSNRIIVWGMGVNLQYAYVDLLSVSGGDKYDYIIIITWSLGELEKSYFHRQFLNAGRNLENMQMCIFKSDSGVLFPDTMKQEKELLQKIDRLSHKPNAPREFVNFKKQKHLLIGLRGKSLNDYCLAAVYPVRIVQEQIYDEKKKLITIGLLSLFLAYILGLILSHSILSPMHVVTKGAMAISRRDFSHRLPWLGNDEFGNMAMLFNETMVDLEELKVAGTVQDLLIPKQAPETGCFKIFGNTCSTADLGGDYHDYFQTTEDNIGVIIADVAGKGVGAALIMAMAKGAVSQLQGFLEDPPVLMQRLNTLMISAYRGRNHYMAFQCLNINPLSGRILYSNAGGWPPLIVNIQDQTIREINLPGPILGATKKPLFNSIPVELNVGESLVLYTDGIVKSRNYGGGILDISGLKKILLAEACCDPKEFCQRIMEAGKRFVGSGGSQEDTSILVIYRENL